MTRKEQRALSAALETVRVAHGDAPDNALRIEAAITHLRAARDLLKAAGARRTLARVRLSLTSAGGALRHAEAAPYRVRTSTGTEGRQA